MIPPATESPISTATPVPQPTATSASIPTATTISGFDPFGEDRNCGDFSDWSTAQAFFIAAGGPNNDPHQLDGDNDGTACESLPGAP
ncbi:MAG: excalibur calcium-binding domain-containing protein [Chloroflexi bacterium]|nr:excalibur calcium-binding domain-containing protein [Chloroflexota bacterium]MBT5627828.1 excalibur calcium-binding domain-containing protein [Chloroflexota bacterium]